MGPANRPPSAPAVTTIASGGVAASVVKMIRGAATKQNRKVRRLLIGKRCPTAPNSSVPAKAPAPKAPSTTPRLAALS